MILNSKLKLHVGSKMKKTKMISKTELKYRRKQHRKISKSNLKD